MEKLPASAGWLWIRQGLALFRRQPAEMATLFFCYFFLMLAMGLIPLVGTAISVALMPTFSMAFLQGCVRIEEDKRVYPDLLLTGFRSPAFGTLVGLGVLHIAALAAAIGAASLVDGGVLWKMLAGEIPLDAATLEKQGNPTAMLALLAVYLPCAMTLWFTAPLAAWRNMSAGKAMFYSFFAVLKAKKAFLVYILAWLLLMSFLDMLLRALAAVSGPAIAGILKLAVLSLTTVAMYCSFYCSYAAIFGRENAQAAKDAAARD